MKHEESLVRLFVPKSYKLTLIPATSDSRAEGLLTITGQKLPPPSKRLALHQKGLKVTSAKITRHDKRGPTEHKVTRINHLPTFEQVRLHTDGILYPGPYVIKLEFQLDPKKLETLKNLGTSKPNRNLIPCIDEPEAWDSTGFEIKQ